MSLDDGSRKRLYYSYERTDELFHLCRSVVFAYTGLKLETKSHVKSYLGMLKAELYFTDLEYFPLHVDGELRLESY